MDWGEKWEERNPSSVTKGWTDRLLQLSVVNSLSEKSSPVNVSASKVSIGLNWTKIAWFTFQMAIRLINTSLYRPIQPVSYSLVYCTELDKNCLVHVPDDHQIDKYWSVKTVTSCFSLIGFTIVPVV